MTPTCGLQQLSKGVLPTDNLPPGRLRGQTANPPRRQTAPPRVGHTSTASQPAPPARYGSKALRRQILRGSPP